MRHADPDPSPETREIEVIYGLLAASDTPIYDQLAAETGVHVPDPLPQEGDGGG